MRAVEIQVLVLDEVPNILAGSFRKQRTALNTLPYLSNELKVSLDLELSRHHEGILAEVLRCSPHLARNMMQYRGGRVRVVAIEQPSTSTAVIRPPRSARPTARPALSANGPL